MKPHMKGRNKVFTETYGNGNGELIIPPPSLDDAKARHGPITETFDRWAGKRVRIKQHGNVPAVLWGRTGRVFGVDESPIPGSSIATHPLRVPTGYLHIHLDHPLPDQSTRTFTLPEFVEEVQ